MLKTKDDHDVIITVNRYLEQLLQLSAHGRPVLHNADIGITEQLLCVIQNCVDHARVVSVALVGEVDQAHLETHNVLGREVGPGLDDGADLVTEDVEQLDVARDAGAVLAGGEGRQSVDQSRDDVLHIN